MLELETGAAIQASLTDLQNPICSCRRAPDMAGRESKNVYRTLTSQKSFPLGQADGRSWLDVFLTWMDLNRSNESYTSCTLHKSRAHSRTGTNRN